MNLRRGYTLVELLVFLAISTVAIVAVVGILVVTLRLQSRQSSSGEVQQQSTALLQQLQYYVANSSLVDTQIDTATTTLKLRMASNSLDPTLITLSNGTIYLQQGSGAAVPLTNSRVTVSSLSFIRHANPPAHDSVAISFTMSANVANIQQYFAQSFQTAVTQVSAATFDSNVVPSSTATYNLGVTGSIWNSVNNTIYFSGSSVGINTASPQASLDVSGGNIFVDTIGNGVKLRDASGGCWLVLVNASGTVYANSASCSAP